MESGWKSRLLRASDRVRVGLGMREAARGIIIMMHEVNDGPGAYADELATGLPAEFLESIVRLLRREGWDIVTLEQGLARLRSDDTRRFAVLTFDDGYRSTLTRALPILERHHAPFTVYVPNGAPTRELYSWWLGLRALFRLHDRITIAGMDGHFDCVDRESKNAELRRALAWVHDDYRRVPQLDETFRSYGLSLAGLNDTYFMDEHELRTLARHPLANIGAHTASHAVLSLLPTAAVREELVGNRSYLEGLLDRRVVDLAYPYGNPQSCGQREFALAAECGFLTAVTTRYGPLFSGHAVHALPRIAAGGSTDFVPFAKTVRALKTATSRQFVVKPEQAAAVLQG